MTQTTYELIFGSTAMKVPTLPVFGVDPAQVGRFRDVWMERDGDSAESLILTIYTRNGGSNREGHAEAIDYLRSLPTYLSDEDDWFDPTYAAFRFRVRPSDIREDAQPEGHEHFPAAEIWDALIAVAVDPVDTGKRLQDAVGAVGGLMKAAGIGEVSDE